MAQALYTRRALGASGLIISPLGVGTNKWAAGKNDQSVFEAFQASLDEGINFFDTAEIYGIGKSERLLGACLKRDGRPAIIASKYMPLPSHGYQNALAGSLAGSLARLGVPSIDLYYLHFPLTKIEAAMDQMAHAVQAGTIRAVGVSNCNAGQMRRAAERRAAFIDLIDELLERLYLAFATHEDVHARSLPPSPQVCRTGPWLSRSVDLSSVHRIICAT